MKQRGPLLLLVLIAAMVGFVLFVRVRPEFSPEDTKFIVVFGVFFVSIAVVSFVGSGRQSVEGFFFLPRSVWVVFASLAAAFAVLMFLSLLSLPWLGFAGLEFMFRNGAWLVPVVAVTLFPLVRKRLQ
jgi:hypothetical protein